MTLLTARDVKRLLATHGLAPRRAAGQNFVIDPNTVRKVVREAGVAEGDLVCEVGPGLGSLTLALREAGAEVIAVEVDAGLVRALADTVGDDPAVHLVHADALAVDFSRLVPRGPAALVANLPYNVATPIVVRALEAGVFDRLLVMVQKEVGERWAAHVGDPLYSGVSVRLRALAEVAVVGRVSRAAFFPMPGVDSVTVRLVPRPWTLPVERDALFEAVARGFGQRRKRLRNALAHPALPPPAVEDALVRAGLDPGARAEELTLADWAHLTAELAR